VLLLGDIGECRSGVG